MNNTDVPNKNTAKSSEGKDVYIIEELEKFFNFLSNPSEVYAFALFDRATKQPIRGYSNFNCKWQELNEHHFSLGTAHVVLNRTKLTGRKVQDIESARVLAVDIDTPTDKKQIKKLANKYQPGCIVESSPGKFHLYWKVSPELPLELWSKIQLGLAYGLGGDKTLAQVNKMLRIPGVYRIVNDEHYIPQIVWLGQNSNELAYGAIQAIFPELSSWIELGQAEQKAQWAELKRIAKDKLAVGAANGSNTFDWSSFKGKELGRNNFLYYSIKEKVSKFDPDTDFITYDEVLLWAKEHNTQLGLSEVELNSIVRSGYQKGKARWEHKLSVYESYTNKLSLLDSDNNNVSIQPYTQGFNITHDTTGTLIAGGAVTSGAVTGEVMGVATPVLTIQAVSDDSACIFPEPTQTTREALPPAISYKYDYSDPLLRDNRFTELGIVARIRQKYGQELLRVEGNFYAFSRTRRVWAVQTPARYTELYVFYEDVILDILRDPDFIKELCLAQDGSVSKTKVAKAQEKYLSSRMVRTVLAAVMNSNVARGERDIFDAVEEHFHITSGTSGQVLNMATGELRDAQAEDYLLCGSDVVCEGRVFSAAGSTTNVGETDVGGFVKSGAGVGGVGCPFWEDFLGEVFRDNANPGDMVRFMQELFGYSLGGSISEQKIFCHYGPGANGKSKVLACLLRLSGGYGTLIDPDEIARSKKGFAKSFERFGAKVEGKRLAVIDDIDVETVWNEGFVKNITGRSIRARAEYEQSRMVTNRCKVHLGLNVPPSPEAENYGILRRLCVIPYQRTFKHNARVSDGIDAGIEKNVEGILRWSLVGFRRVVEQGGIIYPAETELAVEEYRQEHFSVELAVEQLFKPTEEDKWQFLTDLVEDVNKYLVDSGSTERTNPDKLGRVLGQKFGKIGKKVWCDRRRNAFKAYQVLLNFDRSTDISRL